MFSKKVEAVPETVNQPVSVETYAVSTGADRLRALEAEMTATFAEWRKAQQSSAEKHVLVEFAMSPWMSAAWSSWKADLFQSIPVPAPSEAETAITKKIDDRWPT